MNIWIPITVAFIEAAIIGLLVAWIAELKHARMKRGRISAADLTKGVVGPLIDTSLHMGQHEHCVNCVLVVDDAQKVQP